MQQKNQVISVITTTEPLEKCLKEMNINKTKILKPIIISFPKFEGVEKLKTIKKRTKKGEIFNEEEAIEIIFLIKMFRENHKEILEEVCELFSKMKVEDPDFKERMKFCMQCIIHKYAETIYDINRLEKVIGMTIKYEDHIEKQREEGRIEVKLEGKLELAQIIAKTKGIQKAIQLTGFTKKKYKQANQ